MTISSLDPLWTDRAPSMRVLDPIKAETTEGTLQDRLLRPILSIAITQRLRYLSYWSWVTFHLEKHTAPERALFEKFLIVASTRHDCPTDGTGTSGIVGNSNYLDSQFSDPASESVDISSDGFTIAGEDKARFDSYYKGILYRLLLFENEWTLTPLGEQLAHAYDNAVDFEFEEVSSAVANEELPMELVERGSDSGCLCQISSEERELLIRSYWYLVTPTNHFDELAFGPHPTPELLSFREHLETDLDAQSEALIESTLAGAESVENADYSENLDLFFTSGRDAFVRSSLVLLLSVGDWVNRRPTSRPTFNTLADIREAWRLLVHSEYASYAFQSLFISILEAVKRLEPVTPREVLQTVFGNPDFDRAVEQALMGVSLSEAENADRSVLSSIRDAVYFANAPRRSLEARPNDNNETEPFTGSWMTACERLQAEDPSGDPFSFSGHSERAYRTLISQTLSEPSSVSKCRLVAGYSTVLLSRLSTRYDQYYSKEAQQPFVNWFKTAHVDPGAITCWQLHDSYEVEPKLPEVTLNSEWPTSEMSHQAATITKQWALDHYFEELYDKIKNGNGRSPQLIEVDSNGDLTFNHDINGGGVYNGGYPNAPTLKFERLGDIFYELGLIESNSLHGMVVTDQGRQLVSAFTNTGDAK
ncbi:hypothetical protein [Haloferax sp. Atlit-4N]|uniref:hypothetical protein n=1 Tax=Haloferax sp. Atlit-4N TaxID=2077206 RepID=UPI0011C082E5|nr:hypothetical protein [Haloferax sp. Atlit-4N]